MANVKIDMQRLRDALPARAKVKLLKKDNDDGKRVPVIECRVEPPLDEEEFDMVRSWQRDIIGNNNIMNVFIEAKGRHWNIYLMPGEVTFLNMTSEDKDNYYTS